MKSIAIINFKTTGPSTDNGDRPFEVGAVIMRKRHVEAHYHSRINTGVLVRPDILSRHKLTPQAIQQEPTANSVMQELSSFLEPIPLAAHNAGFHCRFLDAEWARIGQTRHQDCACSRLLSRRLYANTLDHRLVAMIDALRLSQLTRNPSALTDAEMAGYLFTHLVTDLKRRYAFKKVSHAFLCEDSTRFEATVRSRCAARKPSVWVRPLTLWPAETRLRSWLAASHYTYLRKLLNFMKHRLKRAL
ncbi:3'-5' exonuclease [Allochromatium humboldtianum]|uniref:3'-5' exonuclease n=1 Tax=Allochromatium humboldtianum TaxID=504901 RepID=A0A850RBW6_9GAMM|nr:3'-5' exonuclease [Allochromatium humboldtianum]NVZ09776.1 3'-5' exonuclease [Allochromatium humboldtianum]